MSKETTPATRLDIIYEQIGNKADDYARNISGYILDGDELGAENNPQKHSYDRAKRYYKAGAIPYGERLAAAEDLIEKISKALERVLNHSPEKGVPGCTWGDTGFDSISVAVGYNQALTNLRPIANQAMNDYNAYVELNKTISDDTANR